MIHGAQTYFRELRRNGRRIVLVTLALDGLSLGAFFATRIPGVREAINTPPRPIVRFGFEGPERIVETVILSSRSAGRAPLVDVGEVETRAARPAGEGPTAADLGLERELSQLSTVVGLGDDDVAMLARSRARRASVPLVQQSELVIESMLEPIYPEKLYAQGVEGRVALMALVDTSGAVVQMSIVGGSGYVEFEESALDAVRLARFRPYRPEGRPQEVYALIRYRFTID